MIQFEKSEELLIDQNYLLYLTVQTLVIDKNTILILQDNK